MKFLKAINFSLFVSLFMSSCGVIDSSKGLKSAGDSSAEGQVGFVGEAKPPSIPDDFSAGDISHVAVFEGEELKCYISLKGRPELLPVFIQAKMSAEEYAKLSEQEPDTESLNIAGVEPCDAQEEAQVSFNVPKMQLYNDSAVEIAGIGSATHLLGSIVGCFGTTFGIGIYLTNNDEYIKGISAIMAGAGISLIAVSSFFHFANKTYATGIAGMHLAICGGGTYALWYFGGKT